MPLILIIIAVIAVVVVLAALKAKSQRQEPVIALPTVEPEKAPLRDSYALAESIFSPAERSFFGVLQTIGRNGVTVVGKIRLADIFTVQKGMTRGEAQSAFNRISGKHVDFLLIRDTDCRPVLGIELDDSSHAEKARVERDSFVDGVFKSARLPLLHIPAKAAYDPREIDQKIREAIGAPLEEASPPAVQPSITNESESVSTRRVSIAHLWTQGSRSEWDVALERYWEFVQPKNLELERSLDPLDHSRIERLNAEEWYNFLRLEYFRWKYTAANRYATTTRYLAEYKDQPDGLERLHSIKRRLLALEPENAPLALATVREIKGLGVAGASGLLAILYPEAFGTVDQFVVKALRGVRDLPEAAALARMRPESLTLEDAVVLIRLLRRKADENNSKFGTSKWTPRKIDKVLWTYGRE